MARAMTTVQQSSTIRFGSAKFEVGETEETLMDLGAMNGVGFEESWEEVYVESDNAGRVFAGVKAHSAILKGELMEINLKTLAMLRGGIDKFEEISAEEGKKAAIRLLSGGFSEFTPRIVRVTNYNDQGEEFRITVFKATPASGITVDFPASDADDPAMTPIEMVGTLDVSKAVGEQLFEIYDEQGVIPTP